jgi:hypothetical protein
MKNVSLTKTLIANNYFYLRMAFLFALCLLLIFAYQHAYATDLLAGTDADIKDTISGTGRKWLYWIDGGAAVLLFTQRKNFITFFSVLGVAMFVNILILLAS